MAATTKLLHLRPKTLHLTTTATTPTATSVHLFSSSTTPDPDNTASQQPNPHPPPPAPSQSQSQSQSQSRSPFSFSAYFSDVKDSLKQQQPQQSQRNPQSQPHRKPFSFASPISRSSDQIEEIRKNLLEFRRRSAPPPPPTPPPPPSSTSSTTSAPNSSRPISFQELYQRGLASKGQESAPGASEAVVKNSFSAIRESLNQLKSQGGGTTNNAMPISRWKGSLTTRPLDPSLQSLQQRVNGGSDHLPLSIFGPEMKKEEEEDDSTKIQTEFVRSYSPRELGEKLRALRPEKRDKKDWFSLEELSERLVKLREMEEKERNSMPGGVHWSSIRIAVMSMNVDEPKSKCKLALFAAHQTWNW